MGWIMPALSLAGTAISAYGQYQQGKSTADVYKYNQAIAKQRSQYIQESADIEQMQLERDVKKYLARQRVIQGASGGALDVGSNLDVLLGTRREADLDAAIIRYNADVGSWEAMSEANLYGSMAQQAKAAGWLGVGSTLLTGTRNWDWTKLSSGTSDFRRSVPATSYSGPPLTKYQKMFGV